MNSRANSLSATATVARAVKVITMARVPGMVLLLLLLLLLVVVVVVVL